MASADWARLYRLSLYLLCELHPSLVFSTLALHFPMRETLTHLTHSPTHSPTQTVAGKPGGDGSEDELEDHKVSKILGNRWGINFARLEAMNYFKVKWSTGGAHSLLCHSLPPFITP